MPRITIDSQLNLAADYRALAFTSHSSMQKPLMSRESNTPPTFHVSERHLHCIWADNRLRPTNLTTLNGEPVTVMETGRWNLEAGPDFLDAVLSTGRNPAIRRGDIEIHIDPSSWIKHGHHKDPAYSNVIAHICFKPGNIITSLPPGTMQIDIGSAIKSTPGLYPEDVDLTSYPCYSASRTSGECSTRFRNLARNIQIHILSAAGQERLRLKSHRMKRLMDHANPEQILYQETMAALGYKHNTSAFRTVAALTPIDEIRNCSNGNNIIAYSILLGTSGLLPKEISSAYNTETKEFVRSLWDHWWKHESLFAPRMQQKIEWHLSSVRPQNHPSRRLALAACLFHSSESMPEQIIRMMHADSISIASLQEIFSNPASIPYWKYRMSLTGKPLNSTTAMLGQERVSSILINVLIPFLNAMNYDITALLKELPPENFNSITRNMLSILSGPDCNTALYRHALVQQGLIQIFSDFCLNKDNLCSCCPFANAVNSTAPPL